MAGISSKLCHCAPPLLRAFNLSNQTFSFLQNGQVATFSHHHPVILTKSTSVPPLSFCLQNPPYGHFPTIASSIARIPSNECLHDHPSHLDHIKPINKTTQPSSASAFSFLLETSPNSSVAVATETDILPTMHASLLMQMWRELQTEAGLCSTPHATVAATQPSVEAKYFSGGSDVNDKAEALCECEKASSSSSSASSSSAESEITERRNVEDNVIMLSLGISSFSASSGDESELLATKEITGSELAIAFLSLPTPDTCEKDLHVKGRLKLEEQSRRELTALADRHHVSRFPFHCRIQLLIRLTSRQQEVEKIRYQQTYQKLQAGKCETRSNIYLFFRERGEDRSQHDINEVLTEENMIFMQVQQSNSYVFITLLSQYKDLQERQFFDASWDERSLRRSYRNWLWPSNVHMLQSWHGEVASKWTKMSYQEQFLSFVEYNGY